MGLLDALFDPSTFSGSGGGLLDLIRQQSQYQPGQGFGDAPASPQERMAAMPGMPPAYQPAPQSISPQNYDPQTFAPNQAAPISIGGYQMPRIGAAPMFASAPDAALPANALPTQGQLPPPSAPMTQPPQSQLPPAFGPEGGGFLDRLKNIGNPDGLIAKLTGSDTRSIAQQNLRAQFEATRQVLERGGVPPQEAAQKAMLAALNPKAAETILNEALTNKEKYGVISEDPLEGKKYGFINEREQTINGKPIGAGGTSSEATGLQGLTQSIADKRASGATTDQLLSQVPTAYQGYIRSLLRGEALPQNMGRASNRSTIMTIAHAIDPKFDETLIPLRTKTATDYAPNGQSGRSIVALNTVQHHIGKLSDDLENLGDTGWTMGNAAWNSIARNTPLSPVQGKASQAVQDDIKAVTDEMSAAYKAGRVSDHEIEAWNKLANSNLPVRQLKQGMFDFVGLLNGKRDQLNETHMSILGREAPGINRELNDTITKRVTQRNSDAPAAPAGGVAEGATATNPQTGQKLTYRGGKWQ